MQGLQIASCGAQGLPEDELLGEHTGVWKSLKSASQRDNMDPLGLEVLRRDKVVALAYTSEDAPEDVKDGASGQTHMAHTF